jgi:hypothetical protein
MKPQNRRFTSILFVTLAGLFGTTATPLLALQVSPGSRSSGDDSSGTVAAPAIASVHAATAPSPELQAELVAQLHKYIGEYKKLIGLELSASAKYVKVTGITLSGHDDTYLYVRFAVRIRERLNVAVLYTLDGSARGKFHLGQVTPAGACIAAPPGSYTALTVTSLDIPRVSGPNEYDAAKRAIAANFPANICVPLYPSITINKASVEECVQYPAKPSPVPNTARFTVALSNLSARTVRVRYATADRTARAGTDYTAVSGTLTIPSLSSSGTISVPLRCRHGNQGDRTFTVNLTNPVNGILMDNQGQGLIIDFPEP